MHTPTPWAYTSGIGDYEIIYEESKGKQIGRIALLEWEPDAQQAEENAEFIVKACNAHEALVEACKMAYDKAVSTSPLLFPSEIKALKDALALAEKEM